MRILSIVLTTSALLTGAIVRCKEPRKEGGPVVPTSGQHRLLREIFENKNDFVTELENNGFDVVREGFEQSVWDEAEVFIGTSTPPTLNITNKQLIWTSNVPGNNIRVGSGAAHRGARGVFLIPHGNQSATCYNDEEEQAGTATCPWAHDGWVTTSTGRTLYAVGAYVHTNTPYASLEWLLDGSIVDF